MSFRACEILSDIGLKEEIEANLARVEKWSSYHYKSHVVGGRRLGEVNHFDMDKERPYTGFRHYANFVRRLQEQFTYSCPNHYSQHRLAAALEKEVLKRNCEIVYGMEYFSH